MPHIGKNYTSPLAQLIMIDSEQMFATSGILVEEPSGTMSAGTVEIWNQGNDD